MSNLTVGSVTVLGAGTMGAQIALHFANVGIPSLLLDMTADAARQGLQKARALKPDPQFTPDVHTLVTTGDFDTGLDQIGRTDWIIEAIVERLDAKQDLLARVDAARRPGTIVSSNTSGIPIGALAEGHRVLGDARRHPGRCARRIGEERPRREVDVTGAGDHIARQLARQEIEVGAAARHHRARRPDGPVRSPQESKPRPLEPFARRDPGPQGSELHRRPPSLASASTSAP